MRSGTRPPVWGGSAPAAPIQDEGELVRRAREGERAACEQLYRDQRRFVAANLYRVLGDRSELDDVVQEVFVIAFRGLARFRGDSKLSTWLYRICVNVALGKLRSRARRPLPVPTAQPLDDEQGSDEGSPEKLLERRQDVARVYRVLDRLAPKKRIVLVLHEIQGLDIREIADVVRAPLITVRTRLHYARKEFYRLIAEEDAS
jgi:RNA polymerase sigma-70 factor (ECF subfamily)